MAMLATLEGTETTGTDEYILSRMFSPNDGLGCELLGVDGWNFAKSKVATAAMNALKNKRLFIVPEIIYCDQIDKPMDMGMVQLFGMDVDYCTELLGLNIVKSLTDTAKKGIKMVHDTAVKSTKKVAKGGLKEIKKQTKDPFYALQVSMSPTLQTRAISKTDPTGISTKVIDKTYKLAPDVLPNLIVDKATKESIKLDPTGVSQKLYKTGEKAKELIIKTTPAGAMDAYQEAQRKQAAKQAAERAKSITATAEYTKGTAYQEAQRKQAAKQAAERAAEQARINRQRVADNLFHTSENLPVLTEPQTTYTAGFDWSGLLNWKTVLLAGGIAYFVFKRGKRGKRK